MQNLLYILILVAGFPAGYLLAWLARDELLSGRKWFILLGLLSLAVMLGVLMININTNISVILTLGFIAIICFVALWKSYDKQWIKKA